MMVDLDQAPSSQPLFSKTLRIESKTIFVDVKENANGSYLKIAERSTRGARQTVVMAVSGIRELREALDEALEQLHATQGDVTQQDAPQTSVIFVSNMSEDTDEQAIVGHFSQVGRVTNVRIQTKADGSSRGLALVSYDEPYMAQQAIEVLNDSNLNGAQVRCRLDRNARDRVRSTNQHRAHISNLSSNTTTEDLTAHFESIGLVTGCDIRKARNSDGGSESPSSGYVEFMNSRSATIAIEQFSGTILNNQEIIVRQYYN